MTQKGARPKARPAPGSVPSLAAAAAEGAAWGKGVYGPQFLAINHVGMVMKVKRCWQSSFYQWT